MSEPTEIQAAADQPHWRPGQHSATPSASGQSLIGPTVVIRGAVTAAEDLLVKGRIEGFIDHSQSITIHAEGTIAAEVKAQEVLVEGTVDGNLYGTRRVQIAQTGKVTGNVYAPRVGVVEGASFKGAIDMEADVEAIERRFHEQTGTEPTGTEPTGTEMKKPPAKATGPKQKAAGEVATGKEMGESNAAQVAGKGSSDETGSAAGSSAAD